MTTTKTKSPTVKDVMTPDPLCVQPGDSVRDVARTLDADSISGAPVVDAGGRLIGVVSKTDILHRALEGPLGSRPGSFFERMADGLAEGTDLDPENLGIVDEFMTPDPITATVEEPVSAVARRMADNDIHRIIVVSATGAPIGIVTALDALRVFPG